jgi:hemerythrin-like domain-containing protein
MTGLIQRKVAASPLRDACAMSSPTPLAVRVIRAEHDALAAMLRTLPLLLAAQREAGTPPDFAALRAMLFYVDEFPERLHHQKESELLFPRLRARDPLLRTVLDELDADHAQGERAIRELQHSLLAWEQMGAARRDKFEQQLKVYAARYLRHMKREETEILPRAAALFTAEDWAELDEAFGSHEDPLAPRPGRPVDAAYAPLRERILAALPQPFGWGAALG